MVLTGNDVAKHADEKSCWVIIHVSLSSRLIDWAQLTDSHQGKAYDVTEFLPGMAMIERNAVHSFNRQMLIVVS